MAVGKKIDRQIKSLTETSRQQGSIRPNQKTRQIGRKLQEKQLTSAFLKGDKAEGREYGVDFVSGKRANRLFKAYTMRDWTKR